MELPEENVDGLDVSEAGGVGEDRVTTSAESANSGSTASDGSGPEEAVVAGDASWMGVEWVLIGLAGHEVADGVTTTFSVDNQGQASGHGGVNRYGGTFALDGEGRIEAGPFASTRMAGPPEAMRQEREFLTLLGRALAVEVVEGELRINCEGEAEPLRFRRADSQ